MIPILLLVTATFRPAAPTVGDAIAIQFRNPVTLNRSADYEILSQRGNRVVIRTFQPHPIAISGTMGGVAFRNMVVPVRSVLKPNDDMKPAPLKPPVREPYPPMPFVAIAVAGLAAIAVWIFAALRREAAGNPAIPALPPHAQFRATVIALRDHPRTPMRWAKLADALRAYLAATSDLSRDLTTSEVLTRLSVVPRSWAAIEILHQGDLEKFSPWGPRQADFSAMANQALDLVPQDSSAEAA